MDFSKPFIKGLVGVFVLSCFGYFLFSPLQTGVPRFLGLMTFQFLLYAVLNKALLSSKKKLSLKFLLCAAFCCRVILWFTSPFCENDYWRYLWDGRVLGHGVNPYLYAPTDSHLDFLSVDYRYKIGWMQVVTIYPPVSQFVFALSHLIAPDSLLGLKIVLTLFEFGSGLLLIKILRKKGKNELLSMLYFFNPLVLKEVANTAHCEPIALFFLIAALLLFESQKMSSGWIALALASGAKLFPIVLVPLAIGYDSRWKKNSLFFLLTLFFLYLPFINAGQNLFGGASEYAKLWNFNGSFFSMADFTLKHWMEYFSLTRFGPPFGIKNFPAKMIFALSVSLGIFWKFMQLRALKKTFNFTKEALWVLGLLLLCSPVVFGWYVLWILPLACIEFNLPWLLFSYLVTLSYTWFWSVPTYRFLHVIEYCGFFFCFFLVWQHRRQKEKNC